MATVRTQAGKRLLANETMNARSFALITPDLVAAVEEEAAAAERARMAERLADLFPEAERARWPFTIEQAVAALSRR